MDTTQFLRQHIRTVNDWPAPGVAFRDIGGAGERCARSRDAGAFGAGQTAVAAGHREIVGQRRLERIDGLLDLLNPRVAQGIEAFRQQQPDEDADHGEDENEFEDEVRSTVAKSSGC